MKEPPSDISVWPLRHNQHSHKLLNCTLLLTAANECVTVLQTDLTQVSDRDRYVKVKLRRLVRSSFLITS